MDKIESFIKNPEATTFKEIVVINDNTEKVIDSIEKLNSTVENKRELGVLDVLERITLLKGDKGDKGDVGDTGYSPVKGKDYYTDKEIKEISIEILKKATPKKGKDYFDGKDGKDGKNGINGKDSVINIDEIVKKLNKLKESIKFEAIKCDINDLTKEIVKVIKSEKLLQITDIKNAMENISMAKKRDINDPTKGPLDQRWHGSGGSSLVYGETPIGDLDGVNKTFTLTKTPNPALSLILSLNGQILKQTVDYTLALSTITMTEAPQNIPGAILTAIYYQY